MQVIYLATICLQLLTLVQCDISRKLEDTIKNEKKDSAKLPPCSACSSLVRSFKNGLDRTSRGKFEGGDTAWEEKNQGKGYAISEVRFVEIQERLCTDVSRGESQVQNLRNSSFNFCNFYIFFQCHEDHHNWEEHLEEWWALGHDKPELRQWLCEDKLKVCCPDGHYGPKCQPCQKLGSNGQVCSGRGKCKGSGTRKGNGACQCDKGYFGEFCESCAPGFYTSDDQCLSCHKSCMDQCTGPDANHCLACKSGYLMHTELGCHDMDECAAATKENRVICRKNEFCVNTEGSYKCVKCDKACSSCTGDGPDTCVECAEGYVKNGNVCMTTEAAGRIFNMTNVRYLTYGGLIVATAIIFQRSTLVAGLLGLVVVAYISLSEYYLQNASGELRPVMK